MGIDYACSLPRAASGVRVANVYGIFTRVYLYDANVRVPCRCRIVTRRVALTLRTGTKLLTFLINFLLGVAWAVAAAGAIYGFSSGFPIGIFYTVVFTFFGLLPGLFLVVLLEFFYLRIDKFVEMKKQTQILSDILEGIKK